LFQENEPIQSKSKAKNSLKNALNTVELLLKKCLRSQSSSSSNVTRDSGKDNGGGKSEVGVDEFRSTVAVVRFVNWYTFSAAWLSSVIR
jgi:hypothetical protein